VVGGRVVDAAEVDGTVGVAGAVVVAAMVVPVAGVLVLPQATRRVRAPMAGTVRRSENFISA
jgi:hypothetical protein